MQIKMSWREEWLENLGVVLAAWSWGQQPLLHRKWRRWLLLAKPPPGLAHCFPLWETSGGPFPLSPIVPPTPRQPPGGKGTHWPLSLQGPALLSPRSRDSEVMGNKQEGNFDEATAKSSPDICSSIFPLQS